MDLAGGVAAGQEALAEGRWEDAGAAFDAALELGESPEALDGLAEVSYRRGDYAAAVDLRERAYAGFRARGETRYPARVAAYHLAFDHAAVFGNFAVANGWLERARRLIEVSGDCVERGWVELAGVLATDDLLEKHRHIAAAIEIARRFGDRDLEFDALAYRGATLVEEGQIAEGMRRLDEAAAAAQGGEVTGRTSVGEIFCKMLLACEMTLDVRRAEQWQDVANREAGEARLSWPSAICRMYYGGILTAAGRWAEAESELASSIELYDVGYRALRSGAVVRLADLRVRQGRLDEARQLLIGYEDDDYAVGPLARLHLARDGAEVAATLLRRHIATTTDSVAVAPVLALLGDAERAAGRPGVVAAIGVRLSGIADSSGLPFVRALAEYVVGISLDDAQDAVTHLEAALAGFAATGLRYEQARTRLELARRLAGGEPEVAITEGQAALALFDRLGAARDADAAAALLRSLGVRGRTGPKHVGTLSRREQEVLRLVADGLTNPEIAQRLFISRKTAAHHVSNVIAKLGVRNRGEAAACARDAGV